MLLFFRARIRCVRSAGAILWLLPSAGDGTFRVMVFIVGVGFWVVRKL